MSVNQALQQQLHATMQAKKIDQNIKMEQNMQQMQQQQMSMQQLKMQQIQNQIKTAS